MARSLTLCLILLLSGCQGVLPRGVTPAQANSKLGTVSAVPWFNLPHSLKIPQGGLSLTTAVEQAEGVDQAIYATAILDVLGRAPINGEVMSENAKTIIANLHAGGDEALVPDTVVLIRDNVWHVFPRELTVLFDLDRLTLQDGDTLLSVPFKSIPLSPARLEQSGLKQQRSKGEIYSVIDRVGGTVNTEKTPPGAFKISAAETVFLQKKLSHPELTEALVVTRDFLGTSYRIYLPSRTRKELRPGNLDPFDEVWKFYKDSVEIIEGDLIELTRFNWSLPRATSVSKCCVADCCPCQPDQEPLGLLSRNGCRTGNGGECAP